MLLGPFTNDEESSMNSYVVTPSVDVVHVNVMFSPSVAFRLLLIKVGVDGLSEDRATKHCYL